MSYNIKQFRGTGVAIITPFNSDMSVDFDSLTKLVNNLIKGKVEYLVVLGTTGESVTLSKYEKASVVAHVLKTVKGRIPVVLGVGGNNTADVVESLKTLDLKGISAILSVSPYYNKPTQRGIYEHYKHVAAATQLPLILYNVPGRTGSNIAPETALQLGSDVKNIIGIKEAASNLEMQHMKLIKGRPKDFLVISGDDALTLPILACGGDGVISVVANAYPKDFSEMVRMGLKGDFEKARKLHYKLTGIIEQLFADGSPGGIKAVLELQKICKPYVRLPLVNVNAGVQAKIEALVKSY